jgi:hypothetical protein
MVLGITEVSVHLRSRFRFAYGAIATDERIEPLFGERQRPEVEPFCGERAWRQFDPGSRRETLA